MPSPSVYRSWIGPRQYQLKFIPIGFLPSSISVISFTNGIFSHQHSLQLETQCLAHSLLHELISIDRNSEASLLLHSLITHHIPSLSPSLEFFIHSSLNHGSSEHLHHSLSLLSSSSVFVNRNGPFGLVLFITLSIFCSFSEQPSMEETSN